MRSRFLKGALAVVAIVATAGLFPVAALAATFDYSLSGGFFFDPALAENTLPNPTQGNGTLGGLELYGSGHAIRPGFRLARRHPRTPTVTSAGVAARAAPTARRPAPTS